MADESLLGDRIARVAELNLQAMALAVGDEEGQWERLAALMDERHTVIESVFALPITDADYPRIREMAVSVRETDAEIFLLAKEKKQSIARQYAALAQGQLARAAYLASEGDA